MFTGLTSDTNRAELGYAVLEGVAFALRDCCTELEKAGANVEQINVIGGGSQSRYWGQMISDVLQRPLIYRQDASIGPALGAARLAQIGIEGCAVSDVCCEAPIDFTLQPRPERSDELDTRHLEFRALYADLESHFTHQNE